MKKDIKGDFFKMQNQDNDMYKDMYFILAEGITEAITGDSAEDIKQILIDAVAKTEDIYIKYTLK